MDWNYFVKSHALGNVYIVLDEENIDFTLPEKAIRRLCNINYGIGSDGILLKVDSENADFGLKIFNPDGLEAEKSGNGLRIFCKYLYDYHYTFNKEFTVETTGELVTAEIVETLKEKAHLISVDMEVDILIWERGAGFTLASGSFSCAVASSLYKKGLVGNKVKINMPGGTLTIEMDNENRVKMLGEVRQIIEGHLSKELVEDLDKYNGYL